MASLAVFSSLDFAAASLGLGLGLGLLGAALAGARRAARQAAAGRLEAELKLRSAHATLAEREGRHRRLEAELARARDEALAASRLKSEFIANVSHEIRTPMNAIMGMAQLLGDTRVDADQRDMIRLIQGGAESLLRIINDLLDFSAIESGHLRFEHEPFDLRELIRQTLAFLAPRAREKGLLLLGGLGPAEPLPVVGDAGRVRQVLTNLVGNAIKFTAEGRIDVSLEVLREAPAGCRARLRVRDTGIGIPAEVRGKLFQPFSQADASITRRFGGTGLGLAICRQIVELMGGAIGLEDGPQPGSTFWCDLELARPGPEPAGPPHPEPESERARGLRLLLAEDNLANQIVARGLLSKLGHSVDVVPDGRAVLVRLREARYDAVLMDCQMPVMDGFETARRIRSTAAGTRVPIIALTAYAMADDRARCLAAGMDECITKPMQLPSVLAAFRRCGLGRP